MITKIRLSLDLPPSHHEMIDQALEICGFGSKTETLKAMIETYLELAILAQEGKIPAGFDPQTKEIASLYGGVLSAIARRSKKT